MASSDSQSISQATTTTSTAVADAFAAVSHLTSANLLLQAVLCKDACCLLLWTDFHRAFCYLTVGLIAVGEGWNISTGSCSGRCHDYLQSSGNCNCICHRQGHYLRSASTDSNQGGNSHKCIVLLQVVTAILLQSCPCLMHCCMCVAEYTCEESQWME